MAYTLPPDDLKRYAPTFRVKKAADGTWELTTRFRPSDYGLEYTVYRHSDTHLAAMVPPKAGKSLVRRFPGAFAVHQEALDGMCLLFPETELDQVADLLKLRRRRQTSEAERARLSALSAEHSADGLKAMGQGRHTPL